MRHRTIPCPILACLVLLLCSTQAAWGFAVRASEPVEVGAFSYDAGHLKDRDPATAWCTRPDGEKPPWIDISYPEPKALAGLGFINGYAKNEKFFRNNSRPKHIAIYAGGRLIEKARLADEKGPQWLEFRKTTSKHFMVIIKSVYQGTLFDDICVTELFDDRSAMGEAPE